MRSHTICLGLAIALLSPYASAQWVRINGLDYDNVVALAASGTKLLASITNCQDLCIATTVFSANNGTSWGMPDTSLRKQMVLSFAVIGTNLFAGTAGSGVFLSTNNGVSWTGKNSGLPFLGVNCFVVSGTNLFAATGPRVSLSTNNGTSWTEADSGLTAGVRSLAVSKTNIFAGTAGSGVFRSTSNGKSWTQVNAGLTHTSIWSLAVYGTNLFAVTDSGGFRSTDDGTTWTPSDSGLRSMIVLCLGASETNIVEYINSRSSRSGVFVSTDNGTSWTEADVGLYRPVTCFAANVTDLYAGTQNGVWRRPLSELFTSVQASSAQLPTRFELCQNFPNPFNPNTTIQYGIPRRIFVTLTVYSTLGQQIATLVSEMQDAGYHEVRFEGTGLASGVYFYRLTADGIVETKKLLLVH